MAGVTSYLTDQIGGPPPARTGRRFALAGAVAAVLAVGGVAVAQAAESPSGSPSGSTAPSGSAAPSGSPAPPGSAAPEKRERTPFLAGTVVSASGDTIVITDRQGFQRTIRTSSATEYADGLTATPAAGTEIVAEGTVATVATDKTSLAATKVGKVPARGPGDGRGGPGRGRGHGHGPHGGGPGAPDPSGSASPTSPSPSPTG